MGAVAGFSPRDKPAPGLPGLIGPDLSTGSARPAGAPEALRHAARTRHGRGPWRQSQAMVRTAPDRHGHRPAGRFRTSALASALRAALSPCQHWSSALPHFRTCNVQGKGCERLSDPGRAGADTAGAASYPQAGRPPLGPSWPSLRRVRSRRAAAPVGAIRISQLRKLAGSFLALQARRVIRVRVARALRRGRV